MQLLQRCLKPPKMKTKRCSNCWLYKPDFGLCMKGLTPEPKRPNEVCGGHVGMEVEHGGHGKQEEDNRNEPN